MVVSMKKLAVLMHHREKDAFMNALQRLGVVHVVLNTGTAGPEIERKLDRLKRISALAVKLGKIKDVPGSAFGKDEAIADADCMLEKDSDLEKRIDLISQNKALLEKELKILVPWGDFDPGLVLKLKQANINLRFFETTPRKFRKISLNDITHTVISSDEKKVCFVVVEHNTRAVVPLEDTVLPSRSLKEVEALLRSLEEEKIKAGKELAVMACHIHILSLEVQRLQDEIAYDRAAFSLDVAAKGSVLLLTGWIPDEKESTVRDFLKSYSAYYLLSDPASHDKVPVLLKNNRFAGIFEPITRIFSLPRYDEMDPTPFFAPFFALYVGLCLGDVAYGMIISITAVILFFKGPVSIRPFAKLFIVLGAATMFCGLLLNSIFSHTLFGGQGIPAGTAFIQSGASFFSPLGALEGPQGMVFPAMKFALLIGFIQVFLGMFLRFIHRLKTKGLIFSIQQLSYMMMVVGCFVCMAHSNFMDLDIGRFSVWFFNVGAMLLSVPVLIGRILLYGGLGAFILFNNPDKPVWQRLTVAGLWDFYGFVSGFLGDILSYLRLFALGLSGGLLGGAFNYIAFIFITDGNGTVDYLSPMIILTIIFLIIGHSLNLCLSMIGAFVHPLRLTFVEFYKNLDFQGGGLRYAPFKSGSGK